MSEAVEKELSPEQQQLLDQTLQNISELEGMLIKKDPMLPGHLKNIHKVLSQYEELCHLLPDEEIRKLIVAQKSYTGTVLVTTVAKSSKASITKQAKGISAADL